ncbi:hypothetical protein ATSB10_16310 [Dyella thiooxydans]|uniref:Uncharacterized protein n=1 Tax=Dyella thiooxydans TaxID=445710 RepID=A0A161J9D3_9GAMM|nr:hypothetical protein ATSB10_16310 [Dyella thiooxydans]
MVCVGAHPVRERSCPVAIRSENSRAQGVLLQVSAGWR